MQDHYFSENPSTKSAPSTITLKARDVEVRLHVDKGVFSAREIDKGTQILLEADTPPSCVGDLLDIGCGYGPIAITLATRYPDRQIWAVDINDRAIALTQQNAQSLGLANIKACRPEEVPDDVRFAGVYSNPPIKVGNAVLHGLLLRWLRVLQAEGTAFLVVHKHLGSDSLARWLVANDFDVERMLSIRGYRVLRVEHRS